MLGHLVRNYRKVGSDSVDIEAASSNTALCSRDYERESNSMPRTSHLLSCCHKHLVTFCDCESSHGLSSGTFPCDSSHLISRVSR